MEPFCIAETICVEAGTKRRSLVHHRPQVCPEANELLLKSKERLEAVSMNLLGDIVDDAPVLSPRLSRPKGITKRQVERCISELSEHWSDQELNDVIDMFQAHGLL